MYENIRFGQNRSSLAHCGVEIQDLTEVLKLTAASSESRIKYTAIELQVKPWSTDTFCLFLESRLKFFKFRNMSGIEKRFPQKYNLKSSNKHRRIWQNIPKTVVKYDKLYRINSKQFVSRYIHVHNMCKI